MNDTEKGKDDDLEKLTGPNYLNCLRCGSVILAKLRPVHNKHHELLDKHEAAANAILTLSNN